MDLHKRSEVPELSSKPPPLNPDLLTGNRRIVMFSLLAFLFLMLAFRLSAGRQRSDLEVLASMYQTQFHSINNNLNEIKSINSEYRERLEQQQESLIRAEVEKELLEQENSYLKDQLHSAKSTIAEVSQSLHSRINTEFTRE